ncbi:MAG TPA: hypothetical protein VIT65_01550 [Microlunatus sp.]
MLEKGALAVGVAGAALVAASLVGGAVSVAAGVNAWSTAWTAEATLAAPWPMLMVQSAATVAAVQKRRRTAAVGSALLALSAALAGVSGFFDGQLARSDLASGFVIAQVAYVVVAWVAVGCAGYRLWGLRRPHLRPTTDSPK